MTKKTTEKKTESAEYVHARPAYNKDLPLSEKFDLYYKPLLKWSMSNYDIRPFEKDGEMQSITICLRK